MRKQKRPELPEWDDGRTIASMNVEGMPWYRPAPGPGNGDGTQKEDIVRKEKMTREEARYYTWGATKAALLVVGVMCGGIILFVAFCQFIWFR